MLDPAATDDFASLFEFLPIGAYRTGLDGVQRRANPALVRLNGFATEAEQLAAAADGRRWYVQPGRRADFMAQLHRDGCVVGLESEVRRESDGRPMWIRENAHVVRRADGQPLYYEGTIEEITAQVQARRALEAQNETWRRALEGSGDGMWDWHVQEGRGWLSPPCLALFGLEPGEDATDPASMDARTHPDDLAAMHAAREAHFAGTAPRYVNEHRIRCKDGHWKWVLSRGVVLTRDEQGRPLRMVGTLTDITERKEAEALRRERDRAQAARLAQTGFLSRVSHELRTPLNAILGFAQLLALEPGGERQRGWTERVLESGRHLMALVDDVLDLSAAQTGQLRVTPADVPLRDAVDEVLAMLAGPAAEARVRLHDELGAAAQLSLRADRRRLVQVLANLLSNAVKYNRAGGWVRLSARREGEFVALAVADGGPGLTAAQRARLFQPFERLGAERGGVAGTGLGLALSRQLVESMGGRIGVESEPGAGATFTVRLPATRP